MKFPDLEAVTEELPLVSVIVAAYNEQNHIREKIQNIIASDYPQDKIEIIIGSDGSNDKTNRIIQELANRHKNIIPLLFAERRGKSSILNDCAALAQGTFLILTDAKAKFDLTTIHDLLKNFRDPEVGIAGATIINENAGCRGMARQESAFMSKEIAIKYNEGKAFGSTIGVYGACYAIRRELFPKVPPDFAVDDFYICMCVLEKGKKVILDKESVCYENVTNNISEEFRRKVRIGFGNVQNLRAFANVLLKLNSINYCYFSHKVLRWTGPLFLILMFVFSIYLWPFGWFYKILLGLQIFSILSAILDFYLRKYQFQIIILRFITHFYTMNLALLVGFIKYLRGVKANVWEPTRR